MRSARSLILWLLAGVAGLVLLIWAYPRAFPFLPQRWTISRQEAVDIALERFRDLGEPVKDPYIVARMDQDPALERRLQLAADRRGLSALRSSDLPSQVMQWEVWVYPSGARYNEWTYLAEIAPSGKISMLRLRLDPLAKGSPIAQPEARRRADEFLARQGVDLARYDPPEIRSQQLAGRTPISPS
jgi:hypothetical protein